jgi:hypothetical protein
MSSRLAADRQNLEKECDILQEEWQQEERNYHYLTSLNVIADTNLDKVRMEDNWRNGVEKMLPEFKSLQELYQNKLIQQENLAKQLRIDQRSLKENEHENMTQVCGYYFPQCGGIIRATICHPQFFYFFFPLNKASIVCIP